MSYEIPWVLPAFIFGLSVGIMFYMVVDTDVVTQLDIDKIHQAEKECLIKEYYYVDEHRTFCDKIGVKP